MTVLVYGQLRRTSPDISLMADHWERWQRANVRLDAAFNRAKHALQLITCDLELPMELVTQIARVAVVPSPAASAATASEAPSPPPPADVPAPLEISASETRGRQPPPGRDDIDIDGSVHVPRSPGAQHVPATGNVGADATGAGIVSEWRPPTLAFSTGYTRLLGVSAAAMTAAGAALQQLTDVHTTWEELRNYTATAQLEPGRVFDTVQLAQLLSTYLRFGTVPVDTLGVCRLAAQQRQWDVLGGPLPFLASAWDCPFDAAQ